MTDVKIYVKQGCPHCEAALRYLQQEQIDFEQVDVNRVPGAQDEALQASGGQRRVPIIVRGDDVEVGFRGGY
jgi:glutaredoxin